MILDITARRSEQNKSAHYEKAYLREVSQYVAKTSALSLKKHVRFDFRSSREYAYLRRETGTLVDDTVIRRIYMMGSYETFVS